MERTPSRRGPVRLAAALLWLAALSVADAAEWERVHSTDDLTIDTRARPDSPIKELRAEGLMAAPPHVVRAVLADTEHYPEFMPYVKVSRILARDPTGLLVYQRLSFGALRAVGLSDRDHILRIVEWARSGPEGRRIYKRVWTAMDGPGPPPEPAVVRLTMNRGFWELHPGDDASTQTKAVYCVFTNPGGSLPAWIVNEANSSAVPKVFAAVRKRATDKRYATAAPPALPTAPPDPAVDAGLCE